MSKFELTKTIEARKLNKPGGVPTNEASVTIPYGSIVEDMAEGRGVYKFSYLGEPYQCASDVIGEAITPVQSVGAQPGAAAPSSGSRGSCPGVSAQCRSFGRVRCPAPSTRSSSR